MGIDKVFSLSTTFFRNTIGFILPFICGYSILIILINHFFGFSDNAVDDLISIPTNIYDFFSLLITYILNTLYSILIIKFIFDKIHNLTIKLNINFIFQSVFRITGLYIIIFILPILVNMILIGFIPQLGILLLTIPILFFITFYSQYLIINKEYTIMKSILTSYIIIKYNINQFVTIIFINIFFIILIIYFSIILSQVSFIINSILLNIQLYFLSIINIFFYNQIKDFSNE